MKSILRTGNEVNDNGNVKWDEDSLLITEAQKNSTMKITEPKTPYIHYDHEKDIIKGHTAEIPPLELSQAMDQIELERKTGNRAVNDDAAKDIWDKEEEEEEIEKTKEEEEKHAKFERMRSRHYDMKAALANKSFNDDDE